MFTCSNGKCRASFNDVQANKLKGDCDKCGQPLANENGVGWLHLHPESKPPAKPAAAVTTNAATPAKQPANPPPSKPTP